MLFTDKHTEYVLAVEKTGSFTEAARQLFISQPALSQVIRQIESELNTPLFDRKTSPLQLTPAGREYLRAARQITSIENELTAYIGEMKNEVYGTVRLGISVQRGMRLLPTVLPPIMQKYPHLRIELEEYGSDTLEKMVINGTCDFALITTSAESPHLRYRLVENEKILLIASLGTALAARIPDGETISILEAAGENFISLAQGHSVRMVQDQLFFSGGIRPHILIESHNIDVCRRLTIALNAVMLCPDVYISKIPDLDISTRIHAYPLREIMTQRHSYLCSRKETQWQGYMEEFYELLCRACRGGC